MSKLPALFIGHGSPMNTLEDNDFTRCWRAFGQSMPRPEALLLVSAHWYFGATAVTAMAQPRTIHDFYGFPQALFDFQYPAPGAPEIAGEIVEIVKPLWVGLDHDQWGIDHGSWSVLAHMYPEADIPVIQLSINALKPLEYHLDLARKLNKLREKGVMIVASGNVVHNLRLLEWNEPDLAFDWARRFDEVSVQLLAEAPSDALKLLEHPDYELAVPTPDHFVPLLYLAGIAAEDGEMIEPLVRGYAMGSISMTCYGVGANVQLNNDATCAAGLPPNVPPEQTNM